MHKDVRMSWAQVMHKDVRMPWAQVMHKDVRMPWAHGCAGAAMRRSDSPQEEAKKRVRLAGAPYAADRSADAEAAPGHRGADRDPARAAEVADPRSCPHNRYGASSVPSLGFERIAADTHPALVEWAAKESAAVGDARSQAPTDQRSSSKPPAPRSPVTGLLTRKEGEVLVARNLSNKQIARALAVGDETVKRRVKNLFSKLNAARREHLVVRARMLDLLNRADSASDHTCNGPALPAGKDYSPTNRDQS
jgi:DNA-binding CsgD family transcriptional regulator